MNYHNQDDNDETTNHTQRSSEGTGQGKSKETRVELMQNLSVGLQSTEFIDLKGEGEEYGG